MAQTFDDWIETAGRLVDLIGVAVILIGIAVVAVRSGRRLVRHEAAVYHFFRHELGRAILLGLELLIAADIIRTVAITPTLESLAVLAGIVLIRTFLSFSLEVEIKGRWPWSQREDQPRGRPPSHRGPMTRR